MKLEEIALSVGVGLIPVIADPIVKNTGILDNVGKDWVKSGNQPLATTKTRTLDQPLGHQSAEIIARTRAHNIQQDANDVNRLNFQYIRAL